MIFFVPPFPHRRERQVVRRAGLDEVRDVMHKRGDLSRFLISPEVRLGSLILPERMQLGNKEAPAITKNAEGLREDEGKVRDVFEHEIATDQIDGLIFARPSLGDVRNGEGYIIV